MIKRRISTIEPKIISPHKTVKHGLNYVSLVGRKVGDGYPPFIIAEIGVNFRNYEHGKRLIDASKMAGVDSVKIQTFKAENLVSKKPTGKYYRVNKTSQYEMFKELEVPEDLQRKLFHYARLKKITFFSTPSDKHDVNFLENLGVQIYKIGSDDANNIPFLEYIAQLRKPAIVSTGMCTMDEVIRIKEIFYSHDNRNLVILHCVTSYPTEPKYVNLRAIETIKQELNVPVGYSDHSMGIEVCKAAIVLGANVIEKHVTLNKKQRGPDHILSATPTELKKLVEFSRIFELSYGNGIKKPAKCEEFTRKQNRKSIVAIRGVRRGEMITKDMIAIKRPGYGIEPRYYYKIIGKKASRNISADSLILWSQIK